MAQKMVKYVIMFIIGIVFGMLGTVILDINQEVENPEVPMFLVMFDSWGENIDDDSEAIFKYSIYNFGNIEGKNVTIRCEITDINDNLINQQYFNIGNIASNSWEYQESYMDYNSSDLDEYGRCYVESINGEFINLEDRLSDL